MSDEVDYVEGPGPGIADLSQEPDEQPTQEIAQVELEPAPRWEQETIEQLLLGTGSGLHYMVGVGERDWSMTQTDLKRIAPPLTRICNRYEGIMRYAPMADPLLVAHGVVLYAWRSELERQRVLKDRKDAVQGDARYEASPPTTANSERPAAPAGPRETSPRAADDASPTPGTTTYFSDADREAFYAAKDQESEQ
jgi:hypothetical protein